ncbi:cytidine deaminase [bacterium]|nr:cytidine deaminase [bacterium]
MNSERLIKEAEEARQNAYAPYSGFSVGAAVLAEDGSCYRGCNVENASYGLTVCAERNALFQAIAAGARTITALAVVADTAEPVVPCGACLQVMAEFNPTMTVIMAGSGGVRSERNLQELLPLAFKKT